MTEEHDTANEPHHISPTQHVLQELQLYGYRPFEDEPDPRPLPEGHVVSGSITDIFDALVVALSDTASSGLAQVAAKASNAPSKAHPDNPGGCFPLKTANGDIFAWRRRRRVPVNSRLPIGNILFQKFGHVTG